MCEYSCDCVCVCVREKERECVCRSAEGLRYVYVSRSHYGQIPIKESRQREGEKDSSFYENGKI